MTKTNTNTNTNSNSSSTYSSGVRFNEEVEVFVHNIVLGCHPETTVGPSIELGWKYSIQTCTICDENIKPIRHIPTKEREERVQEYGISKSEIDIAVAEVQQIQSIRNSTKLSSSSSSSKSSTKNYKVTVKQSNPLVYTGKRIARTTPTYSATTTKKSSIATTTDRNTLRNSKSSSYTATVTSKQNIPIYQHHTRSKSKDNGMEKKIKRVFFTFKRR